MATTKPSAFLRVLVTASLLAVMAPAGFGQQYEAPRDDATLQVLRELREQIRDLQSTIRDLREETSRYHAETQALRAELKAALGTAHPAAESSSAPRLADAANAPRSSSADEHLAKLQEQYDLLSAKVDDQYQSKVESASKYRVRLSGIALLNLFENSAAVDSQDIPSLALSTVGRPDGSFGGTLRQSQIGLDVFGPTWHGARIKGNIQFDFAGGFPQTENGAIMGLVRLRTAVLRLDWLHTSLVGGQDAPFFSPLSPTSLASLAQPALAYSGNLWTWIPQLRVEHSLAASRNSRLTMQAGILDPLTGERPTSQFYRTPQAGEASRQPAYAARLAWSSANEQNPLVLGVGGYYSRQDWGAGRKVGGWAVTTDASIPVTQWLNLSGEFFRGSAIGGLGGALGETVVYYGPSTSATTQVEGLDAIGGWAQVKLRASPRLEFNVAAGQDNPFASQFRQAALAGAAYYGGTVRNRSLLSNFIYRPRSDLLLSMEYRRIQSYQLVSPAHDADQINLSMGVLF